MSTWNQLLSNLQAQSGGIVRGEPLALFPSPLPGPIVGPALNLMWQLENALSKPRRTVPVDPGIYRTPQTPDEMDPMGGPSHNPMVPQPDVKDPQVSGEVKLKNVSYTTPESAAPGGSAGPWDQLLSVLANLAKPVAQPPAMLGAAPLPPGPPMSLYQQLFANMGNEQQGPASKGPAATIGALPTTAQHLLPQQYGWLGETRPFGPGEYVSLPGGERASEEDYTLPFDKWGNPVQVQWDKTTGQPLPNPDVDHWKVVPGLWLINGVPTHVNEDRASALAREASQRGMQWPHFPTYQQAEQGYVDPREAKWESGARTELQPPIWQYRK